MKNILSMNALIPDNAMLVLALKSIGDCVCISDMDDKIIFVNEAFLKTYGFSLEELLGKPVSIVRATNNDPEKTAGIFPATLKGGWRGELINQRKDGTEFPVNIATSVILDDKEKPIALMGIAKDITETKRMQAKLRSVADLFQNLGTDTSKNINTIVACASAIIGGVASLYNRLDESACSLVVRAGQNLPPEMENADSPEGHICYEATIKGKDKPVVLGDLTQTSFMQSDPNVARFGLKSYLGAPVSLRGKTIGSLAVVDSIIREFSPEEIDLIWILARALSLEEERQEAIIMLETAVQQSPSGILIADAPDVKIRIANRKAMAILHGNDEKNVDFELHEPTRTWESYSLDGISIPLNDLPLTRAIQNGEVIESEEYIIRSGNGIEHFVSVNAVPVRNIDGTITSGISIFHDITAKKQTEQKLRERENRYRTVFDKAPIGIGLVSEDGYVIDCNQAMARITGYTIKELVTIQQTGIFADPEARNGFMELMERDGHVYEHPVILRHKNGSDVAALIYVNRIELGGINYYHTICQDLTVQKKAETSLREIADSYRGLFNNVGDAIYILDINGSFLDVNSGAEKMYGYSREVLIGKDPSFVSAPDKNNLEEIMSRVKNAFDGEPQQFEFWGKRANGETFLKDVRICKGTYFGQEVVIAMATDITDRKNAEDALKQKASELERFNNLMIGRELKMIDLKKEINSLLIESGLQGKYMIHE